MDHQGDHPAAPDLTPWSTDPGRGPSRARFPGHARDGVTAAADHELSVGPRSHLALGTRPQYDGIAGPEHQLPGVDRDPNFSLGQMPDLLSVKDMRRALLAKFTQHDDLRAVLLGTGEADLVEHTASDAYWGDGGDGTGKNRLGHILMRVRAELRLTAQSELM